MNRSPFKQLKAYAVISASVSMLVPVWVKAAPLAKLEVPTGQALFHEYCSQCHGADGTGGGPMAKVLRTPPADLTSIKQRAQGTFPAARIVEVIRYGEVYLDMGRKECRYGEKCSVRRAAAGSLEQRIHAKL